MGLLRVYICLISRVTDNFYSRLSFQNVFLRHSFQEWKTALQDSNSITFLGRGKIYLLPNIIKIIKI